MSLTLIASATANSVSTLTLSSIPSTYRDLRLYYTLRFDARASTNNLRLTFNGSSTSDYFWRHLRGDGGGGGSVGLANSNVNEIQSGWLEGTNAGPLGNGLIYIGNYAGSTNKPVYYDHGAEKSDTVAQYLTLGSGLRSNTAAITSITIAAGDSFIGNIYLYGIGTL